MDNQELKEKLELAFDLGYIAAKQKKPISSNPYQADERFDKKDKEAKKLFELNKSLSEKWKNGFDFFNQKQVRKDL